MLLSALRVEIETKNLNLQASLLVRSQTKKVWERRSHPTTSLVTKKNAIPLLKR